MGTNASQMIQVEYIVNPIYLASLKFSGIFLVLKAYKVHNSIRNMLYKRDITRDKFDMPQVKTEVKG